MSEAGCFFIKIGCVECILKKNTKAYAHILAVTFGVLV